MKKKEEKKEKMKEKLRKKKQTEVLCKNRSKLAISMYNVTTPKR